MLASEIMQARQILRDWVYDSFAGYSSDEWHEIVVDYLLRNDYLSEKFYTEALNKEEMN